MSNVFVIVGRDRSILKKIFTEINVALPGLGQDTFAKLKAHPQIPLRSYPAKLHAV